MPTSTYYVGLKRREGASPETIQRRIGELQRAAGAPARTEPPRPARPRGGSRIPLASHDDRTETEIAENAADGIRISEFPVTMAAARAAKRAGMQVIAGAPNIVRGGSHSGNVRAADLVSAEAVDAFASDYVPASLVEAAFLAASDAHRPRWRKRSPW